MLLDLGLEYLLTKILGTFVYRISLYVCTRLLFFIIRNVFRILLTRFKIPLNLNTFNVLHLAMPFQGSFLTDNQPLCRKINYIPFPETSGQKFSSRAVLCLHLTYANRKREVTVLLTSIQAVLHCIISHTTGLYCSFLYRYTRVTRPVFV